MDEKIKDFLTELAGLTRGQEKPDLEKIFSDWKEYFNSVGIIGPSEQMKELKAVLNARASIGVISIVAP